MKRLIALFFMFALCDMTIEVTKADAQCVYTGSTQRQLGQFCDLENSVSYTFTGATTTLNSVFRGAVVSSVNTSASSGAASYNASNGVLSIPNYTPAAKIYNFNVSRSIVTTAGAANGWQVSSTREAHVSYGVTIQCAVQIGLVTNVDGYLVLEMAPTNSTTASDWVEVTRVSASQNIALAIALSSTQKSGGTLSGVVPAGYYTRIRSVTVAGTPTYTYNSGQESY